MRLVRIFAAAAAALVVVCCGCLPNVCLGWTVPLPLHHSRIACVSVSYSSAPAQSTSRRITGYGLPPPLILSKRLAAAARRSQLEQRPTTAIYSSASENNDDSDNTGEVFKERRNFLSSAALSSLSVVAATASIPSVASAAVGTLPEFQDTNAIFQGLTIQVADQSQQQQMVDFLLGSFDFTVLRQRIMGPVEEIWLGYGPEELNIPKGFIPGVSGLGTYGGHASIKVLFNERTTSVFYKQGDLGETVPVDSNIAFVQVGVPGYRISQMQKNGGTILDAYGHVNVISPAGLPMRAIVGFAPDPIMMVAINCQSVPESRAFYENTLGFSERPYPYARLASGTPFEPAQPKNSVYLAPSSNGLGVLLLQNKKKQPVKVNPAIESLNLVYTPSSSSSSGEDAISVTDPSGVKIVFQPYDKFAKEEKITR